MVSALASILLAVCFGYGCSFGQAFVMAIDGCARGGAVPPSGTPTFAPHHHMEVCPVAGLFYDPEVPDEFWAKLDWNAKPEGCWLWGQFRPGRLPDYPTFKGKGAARYLYQLQVEKLHAGQSVVAQCWNQLCVNPDHMKVIVSERSVKHAAFRDRNRGELNNLYGDDADVPVVESEDPAELH